MPDFKNIVNLPEYGEIGRVAAKRLDPEILLRYYEKLSPDQIAAFSQKLSMAFERVAAKKTEILMNKNISNIEREINNAKEAGNTDLVTTLQSRLLDAQNMAPVVPKDVTNPREPL